MLDGAACAGDAGKPPTAHLNAGIVDFERTETGYRGTAFLIYRRDVSELKRYGVSLVAYAADGQRAFEVEFGDFSEEITRTEAFETTRFPLATKVTWDGIEEYEFECVNPATEAITRGYLGYHSEPFTEWPYRRPRTDQFDTSTGHVWGIIDDNRTSKERLLWEAKCQQRLLGREATESFEIIPKPTWLSRREDYTITYIRNLANADKYPAPDAVPTIVSNLSDNGTGHFVEESLDREQFMRLYALAEGTDEPAVPAPDEDYRNHRGHCRPGKATATYSFPGDRLWHSFTLEYRWDGIGEYPSS